MNIGSGSASAICSPPEPIFTPASKAPAGHHDENIEFDAIVSLVGREQATAIRRIALAVYTLAAEHARARDIIIAGGGFLSQSSVSR